MTPDEENAALATPEYWNSRYTSSSSFSDGSTPTHEWFRHYSSLKPFFQRHFFSTYRPENEPRILHAGSGDSTVPYDLSSEEGYTNQLCVDFSQTVVDMMRARTKASSSGIEWQCADVRDLSALLPDESIDVAFDKGTLDAMIHGSPWSPPEDVLRNTGEYILEVQRVLKPGGVFLYVTYRQRHFVEPLLNREGKWRVEMEVLTDEKGGLEYYGFVLRKKAGGRAAMG
ncbi:S-adenosyl-L-methionine-dependent methyltransferase like protein [Zymoseptoria brevis]|uniref:S-adenosyl-L-methionine-dependent methyltransferase like protein n=1 Tax=Zymoseptoria brevis TaxID=1047168 RepID=A0A0F4G4P1_9PEZI|nr:S-adenosyl-L-methionine-dependent methyltransferase like protein [Zymoseptoria brevis]